MRIANKVPVITSFIVLLALLSLPVPAEAIHVEAHASGLESPVFATYAPGDSTRIFIVEQDGAIQVSKSGVLNAQPFLDIDAQVGSSGSEQGLLGLAFHPEYQSNGFFFVYYTNTGGDTRVSRFSVSANPDLADAASEFTILSVSQPFANHNGGMIAFGPDGFLYVGLGDGGSGGDPLNSGQTTTTYLGKILRLDVDGGSPYGIPASNPFVGAVDTLPEIWSLGWRNPWRFSFDRETGDLMVADVGQGEIEEIDFETAGGPGGGNYGWRLKEGSECYNPGTNCDPGGITIDPVFEYDHTGGRCSVTGGYVYRGCAMPELQGAYFFGDYCTGEVWTFRVDGDSVIEYTDQFAISSFQLSSFGEDYFGELYICALGGTLYKIVPDGAPAECETTGCCDLRGDINDDHVGPDIADLVYLVSCMFQQGPVPPCIEKADLNADGSGPDIADLVHLASYMFQEGPAPIPCPVA